MECDPYLSCGLLQGCQRGLVELGQHPAFRDSLALLGRHLFDGALGAESERLPVGEGQVAVGRDLVHQVAVLYRYELLALTQVFRARAAGPVVDAVGGAGRSQKNESQHDDLPNVQLFEHVQ